MTPTPSTPAVVPDAASSATTAPPGPRDSQPTTRRRVLEAPDIGRALTRIAHEILESDRVPAEGDAAGGRPQLVLLGIPTRGVVLAERIGAVIERIEPGAAAIGALDVTMYRDDLRRQPTRTPQPTRVPGGGIDGATVVLVDDVLFSGRTIRAALDALNDLGRPRAVRLAVLVDRGHRELPIRPDFVGKNLPSAPGQRVNVHVSEVDGIDEVAIDDGLDDAQADGGSGA